MPGDLLHCFVYHRYTNIQQTVWIQCILWYMLMVCTRFRRSNHHLRRTLGCTEFSTNENDMRAAMDFRPPLSKGLLIASSAAGCSSLALASGSRSSDVDLPIVHNATATASRIQSDFRQHSLAVLSPIMYSWRYIAQYCIIGMDW